MTIEEKLEVMGLALPAPVGDVGTKLPFVPVRVVGNIAYISGHGPQNPDGSLAGPFGKVGKDLSVEQGYEAARLVALSMLGSLKRQLGELERIQAWIKLFGMVNCTPDFAKQPAVINGASDLILELFGDERGAHARSAVGMSSLPFNIPVEIEAMVVVD